MTSTSEQRFSIESVSAIFSQEDENSVATLSSDASDASEENSTDRAREEGKAREENPAQNQARRNQDEDQYHQHRRASRRATRRASSYRYGGRGGRNGQFPSSGNQPEFECTRKMLCITLTVFLTLGTLLGGGGIFLFLSVGQQQRSAHSDAAVRTPPGGVSGSESVNNAFRWSFRDKAKRRSPSPPSSSESESESDETLSAGLDLSGKEDDKESEDDKEGKEGASWHEAMSWLWKEKKHIVLILIPLVLVVSFFFGSNLANCFCQKEPTPEDSDIPSFMEETSCWHRYLRANIMTEAQYAAFFRNERAGKYWCCEDKLLAAKAYTCGDGSGDGFRGLCAACFCSDNFKRWAQAPERLDPEQNRLLFCLYRVQCCAMPAFLLVNFLCGACPCSNKMCVYVEVPPGLRNRQHRDGLLGHWAWQEKHLREANITHAELVLEEAAGEDFIPLFDNEQDVEENHLRSGL